ncbi:MAG TPA: carotenoid 1,2-hydratase [Caldimonas sp.]|nr:carotenoid 1,2-hydratase [Caldimonas sp.]
MPTRRSFVAAVLALRAGAGATGASAAPDDASIAAPLRFPADFGAHPDARIEWWYLTGALDAGDRAWGFQITFFRAATQIAGVEASRFAARQLLFAHGAVSDLAARRLRHDQRIARSGFGIAEADVADTALVVRDWRLARSGAAGASRYAAKATSDSAGFAFDLALAATQPLLLQGQGGISRKGPRREQTSRYYSEPQLTARGTLAIEGRTVAVTGRAWLDHEWSDSFLDASAVGWDWIGMNLDDGAALTAFRLRRADGSMLWSGGSHRRVGEATRDFANGEVVFTPGRTWTSPASSARYPVEWKVATPAGAFAVRALLDDQELDSRASTGAIYWEGLSLLVDGSGARVGRGYLEMTGYAGRLVL